ncbi:tRNA (adenosine(37)-N6)-threonylcarbamoyltransferase complex transferase subunit TsaD [Marinithermus hydrothermalis]|uniref:tRNA N6-adenosine threonylcarbamoyltransferase n=1 Tax=Marinithermus hydrothermalis (strain DSM 14884 / JCM 11576 / T1) TaxID=869210 RepID=F2NMM3_MARHT|nr:tRNA (adenosine(37)-N6)-threonylcarbamoyltransferase complex transferase subunit TsaD [Marinithermus hydrothermalis]AEB12193.1 O-sialoglycoprotein endopeptidase [Marinithermus hydrothermalis DSM 14884]
MVVLGIETSCDDTGVGVVRDGRVLSNQVASQTQLHATYGGVVPELASREHTRVIDALVAAALEEAGVRLEEVDVIAATRGPGLIGALLVGLTYAKALAFALERPFVGVHHLEGHIYGALADRPDLAPPFLVLVASGGHTHLFDVPAEGRYELLGATRDDAAGEAFDKVARLLGLGYPGGPEIARLAEHGDPEAVPFTVPLKDQPGFDFSFSGLKTAAARFVEQGYRAEDIAASFQRVVVEALYTTVARAARARGRQKVVIAGGVAANQALRARFQESDLETVFPPKGMNTDNGAMIALAAWRRWQGRGDALTLAARPYLPLAEGSSPGREG